MPAIPTLRQVTQSKKRELRNLYNLGRKIIRAKERRQEQIELGKTVIVSEKDGVKTYAFPPKQRTSEPPSTPRLAWVGGKSYRHHNPRKNLSGCAPEHAAAAIENASRAFASEVTKALSPETPVVDGAPLEVAA